LSPLLWSTFRLPVFVFPLAILPACPRTNQLVPPLPASLLVPPASFIYYHHHLPPLCLPAHGPASLFLRYPLPCLFRLPPSSAIIIVSPAACLPTDLPARFSVS
ncbi:hypothetical protein AAFF_G00168570, partial [Aldrovandia affinis]